MYRRVRGYFARSIHWQSHDPFARQKREALQHSAQAVDVLTGRFHSILRDAATSNAATQQEAFVELISVSLWGNRTDLSLLPDMNAEQAAGLQTAMTAEDAHHHTVVNDLPALWKLVEPFKNDRVDIMLDNAGKLNTS
jgi:uncharacterized protein with ATP-grasp and redox domains